MSVTATNDTHSNLRGRCAEKVAEFCKMKRDEFAMSHYAEHGTYPSEEELDLLQPNIEEFDPIVELAMLAADYSQEASVRRQCLAEVAPYLRPKLAAVSVTKSEEADPEEEKRRERLVTQLSGMLTRMEDKVRDAG